MTSVQVLALGPLAEDESYVMVTKREEDTWGV